MPILFPSDKVQKIVNDLLSREDSEYIITDDLTGELDTAMGKYMASVYMYGVDRTKQISTIRRMNAITKLMIEQFDATDNTVKPKGDEQIPSDREDRQDSECHADTNDETATSDTTDNR